MGIPESESSASKDLGQRSAVAFSWGLFSSLAKVLLTLVVQAVLARLLGPEEFGLFALGMLVMGVASYFADMGVATSLVQKTQVSKTDIRFVLTVNLLSSVAVGGLVVALAGPLAFVFGKPQAQGIFLGLAPVFVINAMATVSTSLLRRELDYRSIQFANLTGYIIGFGLIGISVAVVVGSVVALVAAYLCQASITLALLYARTRHPIGLSLRTGDRQGFIGFGATVLITNLVNCGVASLDRLLVGRIFSIDTLGYYSAAYNLVHAPVAALYPNLQSTIFSSLARMQGDTMRMRFAYLELLRAVTVVFLPVFFGLYFFSGLLVRVVYGSRWTEAAMIAEPFSLMAPFLLIWACSTPVLWNTGRRSSEWQLQLPFIALALLAIVPAAGISIQAVAWVSTAICIARTVAIVALACQALGIATGSFLRSVLPSLWMSLLIGLTAFVSARWLQSIELPAAVQLLLGLAVIGSALLLCILASPTSLPPTARQVIGRLTAAAPAWLRPMLNRLSTAA